MNDKGQTTRSVKTTWTQWSCRADLSRRHEPERLMPQTNKQRMAREQACEARPSSQVPPSEQVPEIPMKCSNLSSAITECNMGGDHRGGSTEAQPDWSGPTPNNDQKRLLLLITRSIADTDHPNGADKQHIDHMTTRSITKSATTIVIASRLRGPATRADPKHSSTV